MKNITQPIRALTEILQPRIILVIKTIMNDYTPDSLPQRWTIVRQKFKVESENKDKDNNIRKDVNSQLSFIFD